MFSGNLSLLMDTPRVQTWNLWHYSYSSRGFAVHIHFLKLWKACSVNNTVSILSYEWFDTSLYGLWMYDAFIDHQRQLSGLMLIKHYLLEMKFIFLFKVRKWACFWFGERVNLTICPASPVIYVISKLEPLLNKLVTQPESSQVRHINRTFNTLDGYSVLLSR